MNIDEPIRILCAKTNVSVSELGRRMNKSPQAFSQKIKRGSFTVDDLKDIALVSGCELECSFVFPDGDRIIIE